MHWRLIVHLSSEQAGFLINTGPVLHVALVCEAVGDTWEAFDGFLEQTPALIRGFFLPLEADPIR